MRFAPGAHGHSVALEKRRSERVFGPPSAQVRNCAESLRRSAQQDLDLLEADAVYKILGLTWPEYVEAAQLPRTLPRRQGGIYGEWLEACKGGEKASCNFDFAQYITEFVQLGNLAIRTGKGVKFDPVAMKVEDNDEANGFLRIPYENGWTLGECKM